MPLLLLSLHNKYDNHHPDTSTDRSNLTGSPPDKYRPPLESLEQEDTSDYQLRTYFKQKKTQMVGYTPQFQRQVRRTII